MCLRGKIRSPVAGENNGKITSIKMRELYRILGCTLFSNFQDLLAEGCKLEKVGTARLTVGLLDWNYRGGYKVSVEFDGKVVIQELTFKNSEVGRFLRRCRFLRVMNAQR